MAWFKQKRYGFGAYPSSWQGWAISLGYAVIIIALGAWMNVDEAKVAVRMTPALAISAGLTIAFVFIVWRTTEGGWRWRWGGKD